MKFRIQKISYFLKTNLGLHMQTLLFLFGSIFQSTEVSLGNLILFWKIRGQKFGFIFLIIINHLKASIQNLFKKIITIVLSVETKVLVRMMLNLTADDYNSSIVPNTFWYHSQHISSKKYTAFLQSAFFLQTPVKLGDLTHSLFSYFIRKPWAVLLL